MEIIVLKIVSKFKIILIFILQILIIFKKNKNITVSIIIIQQCVFLKHIDKCLQFI